MTNTNLCWLSLSEIHDGLRQRTFSCVDLVNAFQKRITHLDPKLEAYVTILPEEALSRAGALDDELAAGQDRGPLHGVPYSLKDIFATQSIRTTCGSTILSDWVPDADATTVRMLAEAGGVLLGKVNSHEFAYGVSTQTVHARTRNPWDLSRIPGGSSGGSAAAVAAGLCAFSLGSDTAGSIRLPAALTGICGLKPTYGRTSCAGVVAQSFTADHVGPMARSVADLALVLQWIAGFDKDDPESSREPIRDYTESLEQSIRGLRVGIPVEIGEIDMQPAVADAFLEARRVFVDLECDVIDVSIPLLRDAGAINTAVIMAETTARHAMWAETWFKGRDIRYGQDVQDLLDQGRDIGVKEFILAERRRRELRAEIDAALGIADLLLTPTIPFTAPEIGKDSVSLGGDDTNLIEGAIRFLSAFSLTGFPALSVPAGFDDQGLPLGMQIVGRAFDEATVLRAGHGFEIATGWTRRHPAV